MQIAHAFEFAKEKDHIVDLVAGMVLFIVLTAIAMVDFWVFLVTVSVIVAMPWIAGIFGDTT